MLDAPAPIIADAPATERELLARASALAGRRIGELCIERDEVCPVDLRRHKGFVGNLIERALGVTAPANAAGPDFDRLGVELKTVPMSRDGQPRESTFVCVANLGELSDSSWASSPVRRKLARVLWLPIEAEPELPLSERRVGRAILWTPSPAQDATLAADWDELAARIASGEVESISAHVGRWLQLRPKAANARVLGRARDERGALVRARPRGFYLRRECTAAVLRSALDAERSFCSEPDRAAPEAR